MNWDKVKENKNKEKYYISIEFKPEKEKRIELNWTETGNDERQQQQQQKHRKKLCEYGLVRGRTMETGTPLGKFERKRLETFRKKNE